jgi:hypothetical protein
VPQHWLVTWNQLSGFLQEGASLRACDVYCAAFCNISLAFNKTVSTLLLMKEVSAVNITDCGKGTAQYYLYMTTTLNAYHTAVQLNTILKSSRTYKHV